MIRLGSAGITALRLGGTEITRAYLGDRLVFDAAPPIPVYTITVSIDPAGSGTVAGAGQYQEGDTATITAEPADGYKFTGWKENGQQVSTGKSYSFAVTGDRTFTAVFEAKVSRLPAGYTELEYIESIKGGYYGISTFSKLSTTTLRIVLDVMGTDSSFTGSRSFACSSPGTSNAYASIELDGASNFKSTAISIKKGSSTYSVRSISKDINSKRVTIDANFKSNTFTVDGESITFSNPTSQLYSALYLFSNSSSSYALPFRLYSAQIYSSDTPKGDFVPCVDPTGVVGLYELVNGKFYKNSFSGTFAAGPAV